MDAAKEKRLLKQ